MKIRIALSLLLLLSLAASAAAADVRRRTVSAAPAKQPWAIEVTTSGGFTGRGNGGIAVSSDGRVTVTLLSGTKCTYQLDAEALASLDALVQQARADSWVASYAPASLGMRCCDIITASLKLTRNKDQYVVDWMLPTAALTNTLDLWQIITAVTDGPSSLRARYGQLCTP